MAAFLSGAIFFVNGNVPAYQTFDGSRDFKNGFAAVKKGEVWGVIDKTGKWVIQPAFDGIKDMELVNKTSF